MSTNRPPLNSIVFNLLKSENYVDFKANQKTFEASFEDLYSLDDTELHNTADLLVEFCKQIRTKEPSAGHSSYLVGSSNKLTLLSTSWYGDILELKNKFIGASRCVSTIDELYSYHNQNSADFSLFDITPIETFVVRLDDLVNSKGHTELTNMNTLVIDSLNSLENSDLNEAAVVLKHRSEQFIQLANDPTSSFGQLNDQLAASIIRYIAVAENKVLEQLKKPAEHSVDYTTKDVESVVKAVTMFGEVTPPTLEAIVDAIKGHRVGSKEYNAKLKFYREYVNKVALHHHEQYLLSAAVIGLNSDAPITTILIKLFEG